MSFSTAAKIRFDYKSGLTLDFKMGIHNCLLDVKHYRGNVERASLRKNAQKSSVNIDKATNSFFKMLKFNQLVTYIHCNVM